MTARLSTQGYAPVGSPPYKSKNVTSFTRVHRGDVQKAFETADFVLEESYETSQVHQGYIEPRATTAEFDEKTGRIRVWTATQSPFWLRNSLAEVLGVPVSQVQVIPTHTGGGFGAKIYVQPGTVRRDARQEGEETGQDGPHKRGGVPCRERRDRPCGFG